MSDCLNQLDGRWNDGRAARWAGVDLLGCDENAIATEHARSAAATTGATMTQDNDEPSAASGGSATFTLDDVALLYDEWKRRYCGPRGMMILVRRPTWKRVLSVPWMWWSHFGLACQYTGVCQAARLATLFVWAFLKTRK